MKTTSKLLFVALLGLIVPTTGYSQEKAVKKGFIRLVNAIAAGTDGVEVKVDGQKFGDRNYDFGDVTGGVPLALGAHEISLKRAGVKDGTTKVVISGDETTILIPFSEFVPASDTEPAHWEIRVLRLKQLEPQYERSATFVSVSQQPELSVELSDPKNKYNKVTVKRLTITQAPILFDRGYVPVRLNGVDLEPIPVADVGNYVVVLYDDAEGKTQALNFRDYKFLSAD